MWINYILEEQGAAVSCTPFTCTLDDAHRMGEGRPCQEHKDHGLHAWAPLVDGPMRPMVHMKITAREISRSSSLSQI